MQRDAALYVEPCIGVHMALHDVCQGRREFIALFHTAAGNALLPEK